MAASPTSAWQSLPVGLLGAKASQAGIDANLVWADASRFAEFLRPGEPVPALLPFIVELKAGIGSGALNAVAMLDRLLGHQGHVPLIYPRGDSHVRHCTAWFSHAFCRQLLSGSSPANAVIERFELQMPVIPGRPGPHAPGALPVPRTVLNRPSAGHTLIGVIDSGCPFAAAQLQAPGRRGTRLIGLWDQDERPGMTGVGASRPNGIARLNRSRSASRPSGNS